MTSTPDREWKGTCDSCGTRFVMTTAEITKAKPEDTDEWLRLLKCPGCKARRNLFMRAQHTAEELLAMEEWNARVDHRNVLRREVAAHLVATPRERPQPIPGFVEVTEVCFVDYDERWYRQGRPGVLPETDEDIKEFVCTTPRLLALPQIVGARPMEAYGVRFGKIEGMEVTTLESYDELVTRIAAAAGAPRQEVFGRTWYYLHDFTKGETCLRCGALAGQTPEGEECPIPF